MRRAASSWPPPWASQLRPHHYVAVSAAASVVLCGASLLGPKGLRQLSTLQAEVASQEQGNRALAAANEALARRARSLTHPSALVLEKEARLQLGFVREGELLFEFPSQPSEASGALRQPAQGPLRR